MLTLSEAIERLYAHDELAAKGFEDLAQEIEEELSWLDDSLIAGRKKNELLNDALTILGAYEDVTRPTVGD